MVSDEKTVAGEIDEAKWARELAEARFKEAHPDDKYKFPSDQGQVLYYGMTYPVGDEKPTYAWIYDVMVGEEESQEKIKVMVVVTRDPYEVRVSEYRPAESHAPIKLEPPAE